MSKYKKIVSIVKESVSSWKSCQSITSNLVAAYSKAFKEKDFRVLTVPNAFNRYDAYKLVQEIKNNDIELIIWLDHQPNPAKFINELVRQFRDVDFSLRPKLIIHIFGDFVLDINQWSSCEESLQNWPLHFITASKKQQKLVESMFFSQRSIISTRAFSVNETLFNFDNFDINRSQLRHRFQVEKNEKVLLYTGRISLQKNVDSLAKLLESMHLFSDDKLVLLIAGPWDDILIPYFGKRGICGSYFHYYSKTMKSIKNSKIIFLGNQSSDELVCLYHASDLFVSFSTYNDEDFGMSPAEALCCGLPCLLSDWAGYSSFSDYSENVKLVSVNKKTSRPSVIAHEARNALIGLLETTPYPTVKRKKISEVALSYLAVESSSVEILKNIDTLKFDCVESFSEIFKNLNICFKNNPRAPFTDKLFMETYAIY